MLALVTVVFTWQQDTRQQQIETQRAEAERKLAENRAQDEALQAYLDQMNNLLLEHNLRNSKEYSGVRTLARARTLTVLRRLDPSRKSAVMQFLLIPTQTSKPQSLAA
jgi:ribosomal protein L9